LNNTSADGRVLVFETADQMNPALCVFLRHCAATGSDYPLRGKVPNGASFS